MSDEDNEMVARLAALLVELEIVDPDPDAPGWLPEDAARLLIERGVQYGEAVG